MTHSLDRFAYTLPNDLCAEIRALIAQHKIMKEALEFYADEMNWMTHDIKHCADLIDATDVDELEGDLCGGKRAREALKSIEGKHNGS